MESPNPMSKSDTPYVKRIQVVEEKGKTVKVVSSIDATIKVTGKYSGRNYLFNGAGSSQDVEEKDAEFLLSLRQGERQCCGGTEAGNKIFVLA